MGLVIFDEINASGYCRRKIFELVIGEDRDQMITIKRSHGIAVFSGLARACLDNFITIEGSMMCCRLFCYLFSTVM